MNQHGTRAFVRAARPWGGLLAATLALFASGQPAACEGKVAIRVTVKKADFCDVPPDYLPYVRAIYLAGITSGCRVTSECAYFCPNDSVTREQMAVFLCRAAGKEPLNRDTPTFADVPATHWAYGYVERLADAASWGGNPPTGGCRVEGTTKYFCPNDPVTREQMAKFLCIAAGKPAMPTCSGAFGDVPVGSSFCTWIERLTDPASWPGGVGITSGCAAGPPKLYCPKANVTRGQMAVFLVRAFGIPL
jgi:hypothetical protein